MRKIAVVLLLACFAIPLSVASAPARRLHTIDSLAQVTTGEGGVCTAFSVDDQRQLFLTAAHCEGPDLRLDDERAGVMFYDKDADVMVLLVPAVRKPALHPATPTQTGDAIAAYGYAYGWPVPQVRKGTAAIGAARISGMPGNWLVTDFALVGGMSGGPIVDASGDVVAMTQRGSEQSGLGRPVADVLALTAVYWRFTE